MSSLGRASITSNFLIKLVISQTAILCSACYFSKPTNVPSSRVIFILFISHPHILLNIVLSAFWQSLIKYMTMTMMLSNGGEGDGIKRNFDLFQLRKAATSSIRNLQWSTPQLLITEETVFFPHTHIKQYSSLWHDVPTQLAVIYNPSKYTPKA